MSELALLILYSGCAGACIVAGGLLAAVEHIRPMWLETEFRHGILAFGGGVLLSAVALVLVPEGVTYIQSTTKATLAFLAGGIAFFAIERWLALRRREAPQFSAMLLDYLPESIALGGMFATSAKTVPLLALLIGLQNLPEGFNAYRELTSGKRWHPMRVLLLMAALIPLGPAFGLLGWHHGINHPALLGAIMLFAAGGILYLIFQDIAPQTHLDRHWAPPLGAVFGFCVGLVGQAVITGTA